MKTIKEIQAKFSEAMEAHSATIAEAEEILVEIRELTKPNHAQRDQILASAALCLLDQNHHLAKPAGLNVGRFCSLTASFLSSFASIAFGVCSSSFFYPVDAFMAMTGMNRRPQPVTVD